MDHPLAKRERLDMEPGTKDDEAEWAARERRWQRALGRLRLAAEPIEEQLDKYRRVTWALTVVPLIIGAMFVALFSAFRRPDLGVLMAALLVLPVVVFAWLDFSRLRHRAEQYLRERAEFEKRKARGP
jgi:hypothetical protein